MRFDGRPLVPWLIRGTAVVVIVLLWWLTALEDAEWALWRRYSSAVVGLNVFVSVILLLAAHVMNGGQRKGQRLARSGLLVISVLMSVALLELPAVLFRHDYGRTFGTRQNDTWHQLASGINRLDPELIHVHQPYSRYRGTVRGNLAWLGIPRPPMHVVDVAYDRNGFRNDRDFSQVDVVAVGDSFVEGAETSADETVVRRLERQLNRSVANLGQSGYGPQQELVALARYGVPLQPRAVVWFVFGGNDLTDAVAYEKQRANLAEFLAPPSLGSRSFVKNALHAVANLTTPERTHPTAMARRHAAEFVRRDGVTETLYLDTPEGPWQPREWELTSDALAHAHGVTEKAGADLLIVYVPRKLRVYRGYLRAEPGSFATIWEDNNLPEVLAQWCRNRGIAFLDSTVPLRHAVVTGESVYLPDDVHWNPNGHRVVAEAIADRLARMDNVANEYRGNQ